MDSDSTAPSRDGVDIRRPELEMKQVHRVQDAARVYGNTPSSPRGHSSYPCASSATTNTESSGGASAGATDFLREGSVSGETSGMRHGSLVSHSGEGRSFSRRWKRLSDADADADADGRLDDGRLDDAGERFQKNHRSSRGDGDGDGATERLLTPRQPSIDEILRDSVLSFHRDGPLVNPLETNLNASSGSGCVGGYFSAPRVSVPSTRDQMRFVADAKGFDYGIFWRLGSSKKTFRFEVGLDSRRDDGSDGSMSLFIQTSQSMYPSWVMGFGMAGRVGYTGNYEWHEDITSLPAWSFQRLRPATNAGIKTIISVPTARGVAEFGSTVTMPHNVSTVQYIQKLMGAPTGGQSR